MAISSDYLNYVLDQLSSLEELRSRRMFGGYGLYRGDVFFGIISKDALYFKVGAGNLADYQARGMRPFSPYADRPQVSLSYFEVPAEVLEDADECREWARRAIAAAMATGTRRPAPDGRGGPRVRCR